MIKRTQWNYNMTRQWDIKIMCLQSHGWSHQMTWRHRVEVTTNVTTTARASWRQYYVIAACVVHGGQVTAVRHASLWLTHLRLITATLIRHLSTWAAQPTHASTASALRLITNHVYCVASVFQVSGLFLSTYSKAARKMFFSIIHQKSGEKAHHHHHLGPRKHSKELIPETRMLNDKDFIVRMLYKDMY